MDESHPAVLSNTQRPVLRASVIERACDQPYSLDLAFVMKVISASIRT
jgi:hypothetical protein